MKFPETLKINGKEFTLVKKRREAPMAVYKFDKKYLRIGDKDDLREELKIRDKLKEFGFPVPRRFKEAKTEEGLYYYTEQAIGYESFSDIFTKEIEAEGAITEKSWKQFLAVTKDFASAQLKTTIKKTDYTEFTNAIDLKKFYSEFPSERAKTEKFYEVVKERLSIFPFVLTHGDFNSHNLYRQGVIDFENLFYAPVGYDIVSSIFTPEFFPIKGDYEYKGSFRFTSDQKKDYLEFFDKFYLDNGIPRISDCLKFFEFGRAVWLTANKEDYPKVREFRLNEFSKRYLE